MSGKKKTRERKKRKMETGRKIDKTKRKLIKIRGKGSDRIRPGMQKRDGVRKERREKEMR